MSSPAPIRQGRAFVELFTDATKLERGLRVAENSVKKFGKNVSRIGGDLMLAGTAILAPLGLAVREYAKAGSALKEMAERTGVSVEKLSALQYVASQTGATMEDLEKGIRLSQKLMGSDIGAKSLAALGMSAEKLKALSPDEAFLAIVEQISKIPNQADRAAAAMKVFGRGGAQLLPFLRDGRAGIERLMAEAERLGLVMSEKDAEAAHELDNALLRVRQQAMRLVGSVGASLAPALQRLASWLSDAIPIARRWVQEHQGMIVALAKAAAGALALGSAMWILGKAIAFASGAFAAMRVTTMVVSGLWSVLTGGAKAIAFVTLALQGLKAALVATQGALVATTLAGGLAKAAVAVWPALLMAALVAVLYFTGGFREMGSVFQQVWGGISDAIAAGDIELAMRIMWAGIMVVWTQGVNYVLDFFTSMLTGLLQALAYIGSGVIIVVMYLCQGIHWLWTELWTRIANGWTEMWSRLKTAIIAAKKWLGIISEEEASAAIKAEIETRTKTIEERQRARADEHEQDAQRVEDAKQSLENRQKALQKWNDGLVKWREAHLQALRDELAALKDEAKNAKINQDLRAFFGELDGPGPNGGAPDIQADSLAGSVVGAFDIGARMSLQAGGETGAHAERTANATERTADATERLADSVENGDYGYGA